MVTNSSLTSVRLGYHPTSHKDVPAPSQILYQLDLAPDPTSLTLGMAGKHPTSTKAWKSHQRQNQLQTPAAGAGFGADSPGMRAKLSVCWCVCPALPTQLPVAANGQRFGVIERNNTLEILNLFRSEINQAVIKWCQLMYCPMDAVIGFF